MSTSGRDVQAQFVFGCDGVGSAVRSSNPLTGPDATYQRQTVIYATFQPLTQAKKQAFCPF